MLPGVDFLSPQPQLPSIPDVFFVRCVLHNQPDKYAVILLKHLRKVAGASTKLVIMDFIVQYACPVESGNPEYTVPGDTLPVAPYPLLPNFGVAEAYPYDADMVVRTVVDLEKRAGQRTKDAMM